jgi:hemerythrin
VDRLVQYTGTHFAHEERLMRTHEYPDLAAHRAEHEAMTAKVIEFQAEFKAGRAALSMEMLQELENSITGHIRSSDLQYSTFIHETAVA